MHNKKTSQLYKLRGLIEQTAKYSVH